MDLQNITEMDQRTEGKEAIYLAGPYTPKIFNLRFKKFGSRWINKLLCWYRFKRLSLTAANLMKAGYIVFSPISHSHVIPFDNLDAEAWLEQDYWFVKRADKIFVLDLMGWPGSFGVFNEMEWGKKFLKPIYLIDIKGNIQKKL